MFLNKIGYFSWIFLLTNYPIKYLLRSLERARQGFLLTLPYKSQCLRACTICHVKLVITVGIIDFWGVNRQKGNWTHDQLVVGTLNSKTLQTGHKTKYNLQSTYWTNKCLHLGHCSVKYRLTLMEFVKKLKKKPLEKICNFLKNMKNVKTSKKSRKFENLKLR